MPEQFKILSPNSYTELDFIEKVSHYYLILKVRKIWNFQVHDGEILNDRISERKVVQDTLHPLRATRGRCEGPVYM